MLSYTHQAEALTDDNLKVGKQASTLISSAPGKCSYQRFQIIYSLHIANVYPPGDVISKILAQSISINHTT
jgi:hypothetical protein